MDCLEDVQRCGIYNRWSFILKVCHDKVVWYILWYIDMYFESLSWKGYLIHSIKYGYVHYELIMTSLLNIFYYIYNLMVYALCDGFPKGLNWGTTNIYIFWENQLNTFCIMLLQCLNFFYKFNWWIGGGNENYWKKPLLWACKHCKGGKWCEIIFFLKRIDKRFIINLACDELIMKIDALPTPWGTQRRVPSRKQQKKKKELGHVP
jgi:hypothetical protein